MQLSTKPLGLFVSLVLLPSAAWAQAYDSGDATADEQLVLEMINRARANPTAEGTRLGIDIKEGLSAAEAANVGARPPLAMNKILLATARAHCRDMYTRNFFAHNNPDGKTPFQRMTESGYHWTNAAENIAVGSPLASFPSNQLEDLLMIDAGIAGRGHRTDLLDISGDPSPPPVRREVGIGFYTNPISNGGGWQSFMTQDFGRQAGPFLVGVVFRDTLVANNFYDIGEGLPGVNIAITVGGSGTAVTSPGGGFAIPVGTSGSITVTASGGPLNATLTQTITLTGENVRVEFKPTAGQVVDTDGDGIPNSWEILYGLDPNNASDAAQDPDGDGSSNLTEFRRGTNPLLAASTPSSASGLAAPSFPYAIGSAPGGSPSGGGGGGGGGGGCGLTGLEAALLLGLLRFRRR
jgi:hypothetical protein